MTFKGTKSQLAQLITKARRWIALFRIINATIKRQADGCLVPEIVPRQREDPKTTALHAPCETTYSFISIIRWPILEQGKFMFIFPFQPRVRARLPGRSLANAIARGPARQLLLMNHNERFTGSRSTKAASTVYVRPLAWLCVFESVFA